MRRSWLYSRFGKTWSNCGIMESPDPTWHFWDCGRVKSEFSVPDSLGFSVWLSSTYFLGTVVPWENSSLAHMITSNGNSLMKLVDSWRNLDIPNIPRLTHVGWLKLYESVAVEWLTGQVNTCHCGLIMSLLVKQITFKADLIFYRVDMNDNVLLIFIQPHSGRSWLFPYYE